MHELLRPSRISPSWMKAYEVVPIGYPAIERKPIQRYRHPCSLPLERKVQTDEISPT